MNEPSSSITKISSINPEDLCHPVVHPSDSWDPKPIHELVSSVYGEHCYSLLLQTALESDAVDTGLLAEKFEDVCIKDYLDIISHNISKSWAPFKATVVSLIAKLAHPDWDVRNHQTQLGGKHSLRSIDKRYVSSYLYRNGLYDTPTEFALTRSFEKAEPFNKNYSGMIYPKACKISFLAILELINTPTQTSELCNEMLVYLLSFLKTRKKAKASLKSSVVLPSKTNVNLSDVSASLNEINKLGSGSSVVPVIISHTLLSVVQPHLWEGISIKPLKEHTASDAHSSSYGDVEGFDPCSKPKIVIEVKHKITIDDTIVEVFNGKTKNEDIPLKFIITTASVEKRIVQNNICIDTVNGFVTSHLQQALFHKRTICLTFIEELRTQIVSYKNLSLSVKESIDKILTAFLSRY